MPRLPVGSSCDNADQCQTHDCTNKVCNSLVASGAGIACAVGPGPGDDDSRAGLVVALAGLAAFVRRRRGARSATRE
jgi:MYXO-CTERM domain-containing protein